MTNLAARLGSEAKAGQVLMSQRAFAQVEDRVEVETVGELSVKGYSRLHAAYNVVRLKEAAPGVTHVGLQHGGGWERLPAY